MKLLFAFWIFLNTFSFSFSNYKILNENQLDIINLNYQNSQYNENISYKSLIIPNKQYMYYGRLLKYYYSNNIFVSDNEINQISKNIIISGENSNIYNSLFIQNLVATTIMPSIYGSSSDAEFFAESFSKWLNTDNELRNKSWEVTNNFYLKILPEIIKIGGLVEGEYENNQTISHKAIELISENSNLVKYNTKLSQKPSDSLELKYNNSSIIWTQEYSNNALNYIKNQVE
ncbi:hypothetical protein [Spiroplasma endosymbiont of Diplazon laetatorius]|uniref:hypothetical protein n=1 Tax=Spiroplasma endosymbiont of Diplazon laetatorius TaxID=3066322 RepID=UPI0030CEBD10